MVGLPSTNGDVWDDCVKVAPHCPCMRKSYYRFDTVEWYEGEFTVITIAEAEQLIAAHALVCKLKDKQKRRK